MFNLENEVQDILDDKVDNLETFTAYDITTFIRQENPGEDVPHQIIKTLVHQSYQDGFMPGYSRERAEDIQGIPWRYLPDVQDDD